MTWLWALLLAALLALAWWVPAWAPVPAPATAAHVVTRQTAGAQAVRVAVPVRAIAVDRPAGAEVDQ